MRRGLFLAALACALLVVPVAAQAKKHSDASKQYRKSVTLKNMLKHERALQNIADANNGTRVAGSSGNDQTTDYIAGTMRRTKWTVHKQQFDFPFFQETADPVFARTAPDPATFAEGTDFATMEFSGTGDVTAPVTPVGPLNVPIGNTEPGTTASGCDAADFASFPAGNIALVQRGTCDFGVKAENAQTAGASAVVIFNEGQEGRTDALAGTLGHVLNIPVLGATYALGEDTVNRINGGATVQFHIATKTLNETRQTFNVIADSPWGDPNRTVVVSAHNDSVDAGPGINDDGSGTSMDLELAKNLGLKGKKPRNHVRFLWVGAEEEGLLGSQHYVDSLTDAQKSQIIAMLDFDMVASPNYDRQVYDGDGSTFGSDVSGPDGSGFIESLFNSFFDSQGQAHEPIPFDGRSDYVAFTDAGIPAGGLFTGAEVIKTPAQQAIFGGVAGVAFDHCYHQACDTINNLNHQAFKEMKNAAADTLFTLANTRGAIADSAKSRAAKAKHRRAHSARKSAAPRLGRGDWLGEFLRR